MDDQLSSQTRACTALLARLVLTQLVMTRHESDKVSGDLAVLLTQMGSALSDLREMRKSVEHAQAAELEFALGLFNQAVIKFQFFDRLSQRLEHSEFTLNQLINGTEVNADGACQSELLAQIRQHYSMQEEVAVFDAILAGSTVEQALLSRHDNRQDDEAGEIELF